MHTGYPYPATAFPKSSLQAGTSLIEFSVVAVPLLLLGMGSIEITQWFFTKQAISLALLEAGRAAIVRHAHPHTIESAFERAMEPLFMGNASVTAADHLQAALQQRQTQIQGAAPWQIEVLSPTSADFADFHHPQLQVAGATGLAIINNHYLTEQDQRLRTLGWTDGLGSLSGHSVFQANTLVLRLSWLHQPIVPGVSGLMRMLGNAQGSYSQRAMALGGYLPIKQEVALVMQSHPVNWPAATSGKVIAPETASVASSAKINACKGMWCIAPLPHQAAPTSINPPAGADPGLSGGTEGQQAPGHLPATPPESSPDPLAVQPDHPACGVSMCCVG